MTRSSFAALLAAWLGWGFDVFDALLFSFVAKPTIRSSALAMSSVAAA